MMTPMNKTIRTLLLSSGIAIYLVLLGASQRIIVSLSEGKPLPDLSTSIISEVTLWFLWVASVVPILSIAQRIPLQKKGRVLIFAIHLAFGFAFSFLNLALQSALLSIFMKDTFQTYLQQNFYPRLFMRTSFYFLILIPCYVYISYQKRKDEELKARDLETRLAIAQFQVLKSKLNPDFLFHTLRSISSLMQRDIEAADLLTARLGDFLRLALENSCAGYVPLKEEVELVKTYLEIRRIHDPELKIRIQLDPHGIGVTVPNRVLLNSVQADPPDKYFELISTMEQESLKLTVRGLSPASKATLDSREPFQWSIHEDAMSIRFPLSVTEETEALQEQSGFESLEEFRTTLARKEVEVDHSRPSFGRKVRGILTIWTVAFLFFLVREILARLTAGEPIQLLENLKDYVAWYWWAVFTPLIFYFAKKFPIRKPGLVRNVAVHFLFSFVVCITMVFLYFGQRWLLGLESNFEAVWPMVLRYSYWMDTLTYWAIVGVYEGLHYHREYLQQELRTAKLKGNLMEAQVQALKMQLHPHFLFNTLNSISELMHEDLDAAEKMLTRLEDFLRLTFQNSDVQEITLQKELDFLRNYLEIQQVRFQNRLKVELEIDPRAMKDRVPNLILQPIVENAIRHGVAPRIDSGRVEIRAFHREGHLMLEVEDDGPGLTGGSFREGVGMSNTRMRLEQIYGRECRFLVQNNPQGGLVVTLQIPSALQNRIPA